MNLKSVNPRLLNRVSSKRFSWFSNIKRHIDAYLEPSHRESSSALQDTNLAMYTNMRQFQAYLGKNAYDMAVNNEYDLWPHTNFGTIDNPALIFNANATWRMVICSGPGSEEESSTHEKMYMIVREGPIHRCIMCGQCFKLVNLKDNIYDPLNTYYSSVFTEVSSKVVSEPELMPWVLNPFVSHDLNMNQYNIRDEGRAYVYVNADEADHIMTDPAYRMQRYKDVEDYINKLHIVNQEVNRQHSYIQYSDRDKVTIPADIYETWHDVEKAVRKFDRIFNRYEKFAGRALFDPENHDRRERRMTERKQEREKNNYTYYFGDLNECEQQYRDYYESDVEETNDYQFLNNLKDENYLRSSDDFNMEKFDFVDSNIMVNEREAVQDFVGKALFRYQYRKIGDANFNKRNSRVVERSMARMQNGGFEMTPDVANLLEKHYVDSKFNIRNVFDKVDQVEGLGPFLNYVAEEGYNQFMDYYEDDEDLKKTMVYFKDLNQREKIRFAECFENHFNLGNNLESYFVSIPKRPYENDKSVVSNFFEDLLDFNNRVRPIARNLAFIDVTSKYQPLNTNQRQKEERYKKILNFQKIGTNFIEDVKKDSKF